MDDIRKALLGKIVKAVYVSQPNQHDLRFELKDGTNVVLSTEGDCCSETWWADAYNINELYYWETEVKNVSSLHLPVAFYNTDDGRTRQEEDIAYGLYIETATGGATFVYRNSSNGYYGGEAFLAKNFNIENTEWEKLTGNDWRA